MDRKAYPAQFVDEPDGRVTVTLRDFPNAHTDGKDIAEAMTEAEDLLGCEIVRFFENGGTSLPIPSKLTKGDRLVRVPSWASLV